MRHVTLTCRNHPQLRWNCKSLAFTPGQGYNGCRRIFFNGERVEAEPPHKGSRYIWASECQCSPADLILAPEDEWSKLSEDDQREAIKADVK